MKIKAVFRELRKISKEIIPQASHPKTLIEARDQSLFPIEKESLAYSEACKVHDALNRKLIDLLSKPAFSDNSILLKEANTMFGIQARGSLDVLLSIIIGGHNIDHFFPSFNSELEVAFLPPEKIKLVAGCLGMPTGCAFNYRGLPIVSETTLANAKEGEKQALLTVRHEQRHNYYRNIHGHRSKDIEQDLVDELFTYFSSFIDIYGVEALAHTHDYAEAVVRALTTDYLEQVTDKTTREDLVVRVTTAAFILNTRVQLPGYLDPTIAYLRTLTSLD